MFLIAATKPLNDGTSGFRFNVFGVKGFVRKRKCKSHPVSKEVGRCMTRYNAGKFSLYVENKPNRLSKRKIRHIAG